MSYACLSHQDGATSWSSFDRDIHSLSDLSTEDIARMAALGPSLSGIGDWLSDQVQQVVDWVSNPSPIPLSLFSQLARTAPYSLPGVRYNIPSHTDPDVKALFTASQWNKAVVTYSFPDSRWDYEVVNPSAMGYRQASFATEQAVRYALEGYSPFVGGPKVAMTSVEAFTNLSIQEAGRGSADIQVSGFNTNSIISRSHAYYPGMPVFNGDTWLRSESGMPGDGSHATVLHELGHALGLKHPHDSGGDLPRMSATHDSSEYTVMTYNDTYGAPQTFMQYDIAALQAMYGADFTTNSGNTIYTWSPQTGETFINGVGQGAARNSLIFQTIWDGGGIDLYDVSNHFGNAVIDLNPGGAVKFAEGKLAWKGQGYVSGNVYNALLYQDDARSLIENAASGSGNDQIFGNAAQNVLRGNGGKDLLKGGAGNDALYGGDADDVLNGGLGADVLMGGNGTADFADYAGAKSSVIVRLDTGTATGDATAIGDILSEIENVRGGRADDALYGSATSNVLEGGAGHDVLTGGEGGDVFYGGDGNDLLRLTTGSAFMSGGAGADWFEISRGATYANIWDFDAGAGVRDLIRIDRGMFSTYAEVRAAAVQKSGYVEIWKLGLTITLNGVQLSSLHQDDFAFI